MKLNLYLASTVFCSSLALSACQTAPKLTIDSTVTPPLPILIVSLDSDGDGVPDAIDECPETPLHTVVDVKGCEVIVEGGEALEMGWQGFFAPLSSQLINSHDKEFAKIEKKLNEHLDAKVFIFGHMSSNEFELLKDKNNLSRRRALTITNRLITEHHIASDRITTYDCSDQYPSTNTDLIHDDLEQIESKDRRVVFKASTEVKDLSNLKYASDLVNYGKYIKHCKLFE